MVKLPAKTLSRLNAITAKRPHTVIQHILAHGLITTAELTELYGYEHPPRAIRDVREHGVPIVTFRVKDKGGKTIAACRFGDLEKWDGAVSKLTGRALLAKAVKRALLEKYGAKCFIYLEKMPEASLQVDHRVPYEIGGEHADVAAFESYMLLCPSANRAKSWTCEHCENWRRKDVNFCLHCFWAHPEEYDHVAGKKVRQVMVVFSGDEVDDYEKLVRLSGKDSAQKTIKQILHKHLNQEKEGNEDGFQQT